MEQARDQGSHTPRLPQQLTRQRLTQPTSPLGNPQMAFKLGRGTAGDTEESRSVSSKPPPVSFGDVRWYGLGRSGKLISRGGRANAVIALRRKEHLMRQLRSLTPRKKVPQVA